MESNGLTVGRVAAEADRSGRVILPLQRRRNKTTTRAAAPTTSDPVSPYSPQQPRRTGGNPIIILLGGVAVLLLTFLAHVRAGLGGSVQCADRTPLPPVPRSPAGTIISVITGAPAVIGTGTEAARRGNEPSTGPPLRTDTADPPKRTNPPGVLSAMGPTTAPVPVATWTRQKEVADDTSNKFNTGGAGRLPASPPDPPDTAACLDDAAHHTAKRCIEPNGRPPTSDGRSSTAVVVVPPLAPDEPPDEASRPDPTTSAADIQVATPNSNDKSSVREVVVPPAPDDPDAASPDPTSVDQTATTDTDYMMTTRTINATTAAAAPNSNDRRSVMEVVVQPTTDDHDAAPPDPTPADHTATAAMDYMTPMSETAAVSAPIMCVLVLIVAAAALCAVVARQGRRRRYPPGPGRAASVKKKSIILSREERTRPHAGTHTHGPATTHHNPQRKAHVSQAGHTNGGRPYTGGFTLQCIRSLMPLWCTMMMASGVASNVACSSGETGTKRWEFVTGGIVSSSPVLSSDGNTVYVGSGDNRVYGLATVDGTKRWEFVTGGIVYSSPALSSDGNTVYVGSFDDKVYALATLDGTKRWEFVTGGDVYSSSVLSSDGSLYVGSDDNKVYAINTLCVLTDATFKQASWDWVQDIAAAATKWGGIGDWNVSAVKDMSRAFSTHRNADGTDAGVENNPKAASFDGAGLQKWKTGSVTAMESTFYGAGLTDLNLGSWDVSKVANMRLTFQVAATFEGNGLDAWITSSLTSLRSTFSRSGLTNVDMGNWDVVRVTDMAYTFHNAAKFVGNGLNKWAVELVTTMAGTFDTTSLTSYNKRKIAIADAWSSNAVFNYGSEWARFTDAEFKQASWGTYKIRFILYHTYTPWLTRHPRVLYPPL